MGLLLSFVAPMRWYLHGRLCAGLLFAPLALFAAAATLRALAPTRAGKAEDSDKAAEASGSAGALALWSRFLCLLCPTPHCTLRNP